MCGLVYEIAWMRSFTPVFGLSVHATTAVLVAFMAGLGSGSYLAPQLITRWRGSLWLLYALIEIGIGLSAIVVPFAIAPITDAYVAAAVLDSSGLLTAALRFALSLAVMMLPTFFMGTTLPILAQACRGGSDESARTKRVGLLYGVNTLGAASGCLIVGFVLLEALGTRKTILATALVNGLVAALAFHRYRASLRGGAAEPTPPEASREIPVAAPPDRLAPSGVLPSRATILVLYGLIGATSFGYELIWFRSLVFYLQSATYSFSLMLALFLLGIGLGSAVYARFFQKRAMTPSAVLQTLAVVQIGIGFCGVCALHVYGFLPGIWELLTILVGAGSWHVILAQKAIVAGLIILPPTFLMGISFPLMARLFIAHGAGDARVISRLYASNTLGSIVGSLLTGFVLFDAIGIQPTLNLLALTSLGIGAFLTFAVRRAGGLGAGFATLAAGLGVTALAILVSTPDRLLVKHFARFQGEIPFYRESASDITFVYERNGYLHLGFGDGRGTSGASPFHNAGNRLLAYTAMVVNPDAKDILVVSMGCGNTASAFTAFPIDRLDIVDISSGPFEAAHLFSTNLDVLEDPRVHTYVEDGRNFLLKSERRYDIIQIELPSLHTDGVAFLYTREFYEIARTRLKEGGILSQWIDASQAGRELSYRLIETMAQVLPDISVWQEVTTWWAIGAERPLKVDYEKVRALFALDSVQRDMAIVDSSLETTFRSFASYGTTLRETLGTGPIITDDQTRVDFIIPKRGISDAMGGGVGYYNAPLGKMFRRRWTQDGTFPTRPDMGFYPGDRRHRAQLRSRSLQSFASGYWADERQRLRRKLREPLPAT